MRIKMNTQNIMILVIIAICVLAISYGIYAQIFIKPAKEIEQNPNEEIGTKENQFDTLFNNTLNLQGYTSANFTNKVEQTKEIVYTTYTLNEIYDGKYQIQASIPLLNINHENALRIDREILSLFYDKINHIIDASKEEDSKESIYTVSYTAYLNENILSLAIKVGLKEGDNAQRTIIKAYTYNLSTNEEVSLENILKIRGIDQAKAKNTIHATIEQAVAYANHLSSLGYDSYQREIGSEIYEISNSNNYLLGPNGNIYVIYAYGNNRFTTERDIVLLK